MTFEKWMQEMAGEMAKEIIFPSNEDHGVLLSRLEKYMDEDCEDEN